MSVIPDPRKLHRSVLHSAGFALLAGASPQLMSQTPVQQESLALEEVVVTARRRDETAQASPVAVTAFNAQMLEQAGIERVEDFIQLTPNVTLATSQGIGTSFLSIRGQTQVRNGEAPVAVLVDGVLQFSGIQLRQEMFDVESIEVVKGPQGAIYGRNATGGAIIINTKKPSDDFEGYVEAGFGDGDEYSVETSLSGALVPDQLYGRLSAKYIDREGYLRNITRNEKDDPFEDTTLRGRLIWEASETLSLDFRANAQRHRGRGIGFQYQAVDLADDGITAIGFGTGTGPIDANNVLPIISNNPDRGERDMFDLALKIDYETDFGTFIATSAYTDIEEWSDSDQFPYTNARSSAALFGFDGTQTGFFDLQAFSQEFRFSSPGDRALRWEIGAYYLDWERFISLSTGVDTGDGIRRVERRPITGPINPTVSFLADDNDNTAWAVFGQLNWDLSEQWEASVALRYDEEEREQRVSPLQFPAGEPGARNSATYDKWQPKVTLRYLPSDAISWYGTYGEGFRSGQFNQNGISVTAAEAGINGVTDVVDQEESQSYEVGFKGQFADNRLRLNAAVFSTDIEGQQFFSFIGAISAQILTTIDDVSLRGAEIDVLYRAAEGLDLYAAFGFTDSEIEGYTPNPAAEGNDAPYIAEQTWNIGAQYILPWNLANTELFTRIDFERRGEQFWDVENSSARDALNLLNLRFGVEDQEGRWSLIASVDNATDEEYNSEWVVGGFSAAAPGRIWDVKYRYNF
ncbi:TonB-dependent receptor [Exilibacterium tricleocarpae]|uniref:TonB-dependent receptor n=1 Tax=Exilibacterium tricleocarpae TaxID=2591008 RepID=A0A545SQK2_9GAMM|nr:TonB-dependent receptor [Exilibacterium tricleocarpae]TQV67253.1 TonB-dependent receptor [Exilibacterium tricleocarpae]